MERTKYHSQVLSKERTIQKENLKILLETCNDVLFSRHKSNIAYSFEKEKCYSVLLQKAMLTGNSIYHLSCGMEVLGSIKNFIFTDIFSIDVLNRNLFELFLFLFHTNSAPTEEENDVRFMIWKYYGVHQRRKRNKLSTKMQEKHQELIKNDEIIKNQLLSKIYNSEVFKKLSDKKKENLLKTIESDWKISFINTSFNRLSFQNVIEQVGFVHNIFINDYNYLSWSSHNTSMSVLQLDKMAHDNYYLNEIYNSLFRASSLIAFSIHEIIKTDAVMSNIFENCTEDKRNLVFYYNEILRNSK